MTCSKLQYNIEKILNIKQIDPDDLCALADINEYELENILSKKMISIDNIVLNKISKALNCQVIELLKGSSAKSKTATKSKKKLDDKKKCQELLPSFRNVDIELFSQSIAKVDEIILSEGKNINLDQRVRAYMAFYEIADNFIKKPK